MKLTSNLIILIFISVLSLQQLQAQHIKIDKKILSFLAVEDSINIVFSYKDVLFEDGNVTEDEFLKNHKAIKKEHLGEDASEDWENTYYEYKDALWTETFNNTLNEKISEYKNAPVFVLNNMNTKYSMKVHTVWMYFGYNVIAAKWPAKVKLDITFYETNHPEEIIYTTTIDKALGTNNEVYNLRNWPSYRRVGKAYEKGAYKFAQAIKRIVD